MQCNSAREIKLMVWLSLRISDKMFVPEHL